MPPVFLNINCLFSLILFLSELFCPYLMAGLYSEKKNKTKHENENKKTKQNKTPLSYFRKEILTHFSVINVLRSLYSRFFLLSVLTTKGVVLVLNCLTDTQSFCKIFGSSNFPKIMISQLHTLSCNDRRPIQLLQN